MTKKQKQKIWNDLISSGAITAAELDKHECRIFDLRTAKDPLDYLEVLYEYGLLTKFHFDQCFEQISI